MYFYVFLAVLMFLSMFLKNVFHKDVKHVFNVFYLQINVFNIYGVKREPLDTVKADVNQLIARCWCRWFEQ